MVLTVYDMKMSSNRNIFRITGPLWGESTSPCGFPSQRPVAWSLDVFFDLHLNKRLSNHSRCKWFEMPLHSLWRHCNGSVPWGRFSTDLHHSITCIKKSREMWIYSDFLNSLWPSDAIRWQRSGSTLAQVMACCLMAPSHYLNQSWLMISEVQWHSYESNFIRDTSAIGHWN